MDGVADGRVEEDEDVEEEVLLDSEGVVNESAVVDTGSGATVVAVTAFVAGGSTG